MTVDRDSAGRRSMADMMDGAAGQDPGRHRPPQTSAHCRSTAGSREHHRPRLGGRSGLVAGSAVSSAQDPAAAVAAAAGIGRPAPPAEPIAEPQWWPGTACLRRRGTGCRAAPVVDGSMKCSSAPEMVAEPTRERMIMFTGHVAGSLTAAGRTKATTRGAAGSPGLTVLGPTVASDAGRRQLDRGVGSVFDGGREVSGHLHRRRDGRNAARFASVDCAQTQG